MQANLLEKRITEIENWLSLNEGQMFFPIMEEEDLLHKQEVKHKKEILNILEGIKQN
jgi:hypothetical protein